jgi:hypothetical protein
VDDEPRYWYAARPHRWWGYRRPLTWEGWAFDLGALLACFAIAPYVQATTHPYKSLGLFFGLIVLVLAVQHWKGEPNNWDD